MKTFLSTLSGAENTIRSYSSIYKHHIQPLNLSILEMEGLPEVVSGWLKSYNPRTVLMCLRVLGLYASYRRVELPQLKREVHRVQRLTSNLPKPIFTKSEMARLLRAAEGEGQIVHAAVLLGAHGAMRISEVIGLYWKDIQGDRILVGGTTRTKTGQARYIHMTPELKQALERLRPFPPDGMRRVIPMTASTLDKKLRELCEVAGIGVRSFHKFRHTFITGALEAAQSLRDIKDVQITAGHKSMKTTLDQYWNVVDGGVKDFTFLRLK